MTLRELINSVDSEQYSDNALYQKLREIKPEYGSSNHIQVKVADGEVTWLEIVNDGTSAVAEQVTGPWEQTYTVTKSMNVQVNNITAVSVTKNGEQVQFDSRTSGVGSVTIQGTDPAAATAAATTAASDGESLDAEGSSY